MKISNEDFLNYIKALTKSEIKGLNFKLELNPMPVAYGINGDVYKHYLHKIKRRGKTLIVSDTVEGEYYCEDGFLENENEIFTFKKGRYSLKGYNFGSIGFNEIIEHRVKEI